MKKFISAILALAILFLCQIYAFADFENTYTNTGNFLSDLINVAQTQVGYSANSSGSKYDAYSDGTDKNWSAAFISWCANEAGIPNNVIPGKSSLASLYSFFENNSKIHSDNSYKPATGDIIFIMSDNGSPKSCGVVTSIDDKYITAIAGSIDNKVETMMYDLNGHFIFKIATPDYSYESEFNVGTYMTTASFLNFRTMPTTSSSIIAKIPLGTIVTITEFSNGWGKIVYNGATGWINMKYAVEYDDSHSNSSIYSVNWNVIDVSKWQGDIDWNKVASSDIQAVIMRIGLRGSATRKILIDDKFLSYYNGAKAAGLYVGCYFYTTAQNSYEAVEEAEFVLNTIDQYNLEFDMPIYVDMEDAVTEKTGKAVINEITEVFLKTIEGANYYAGVYCSTYWATDYYSPVMFNGRSLWIAEWADKCSYNGTYGMWQYTDKGSVSGIDANSTDLNICYINYPQLIKDKGYNTGVTIPSVPDTKPDEPDSNSSPDETTDTEVQFMLGDIDGNGKITAADARLALRFAASLDAPKNGQENAADVDKNGRITASDARLILRAAANIERLQ